MSDSPFGTSRELIKTIRPSPLEKGVTFFEQSLLIFSPIGEQIALSVALGPAGFGFLGKGGNNE